jgi:hypothetical protein
MQKFPGSCGSFLLHPGRPALLVARVFFVRNAKQTPARLMGAGVCFDSRPEIEVLRFGLVFFF